MKSKIQIYWNARFVTFITKLKKTFEYVLDFSVDINTRYDQLELQLFAKYQQQIREWIYEHQKEIDFSRPILLCDKGPNSYPNVFAIFIAFICDLDTCTDFASCMNQINRMYMQTPFAKFEENTMFNDRNDMDDDDADHCCCSHECIAFNLYYIRNKQTNYQILVGNVCIDKNELIEPRYYQFALQQAKQTTVYKRHVTKTQKRKLAVKKLKQFSLRYLLTRWRNQVFPRMWHLFEEPIKAAPIPASIPPPTPTPKTPLCGNPKPALGGKQCKKCHSPMKNSTYMYCYNCFTKSKKCTTCSRTIFNDNYSTCYNCFQNVP